jgi:hypothetical protein
LILLYFSGERQVVEDFVKQQTEVNLKLLENTKPRKSTHLCAASRISADVRRRHFRCTKVDLIVELERLSSYLDENISSRIYFEILRYSGVMRDKLSRGEVDEKEFVQPEISNNFWKNTRDCLHYNNSVELVNERSYDIVVEDDEDRNEVNGITDHTIKISSCDFHVLTIEDKRIDLVMGPAELGQAKTQLIGELKDMDDSMNYVPEEYCGILQNGVSWIFLFRKLQLGKFMWNYVVAPDTFVDGVIQEDSCRIVTKLVEHVYCVADRIVGDILHPKKRAVLTTSLVDTSNDGNVNIHDDNSGSGSEDYGDKLTLKEEVLLLLRI